MTFNENDLTTRLADMFGKPDLTDLYSEIGEILLRSIGKNFRQGGRYDVGTGDGEDIEFIGGATRWIQSLRAKEQSGDTLSDTGRLATSITKQVSSDGVTIGTNVVYARIHNYGGTTGKEYKTTLPPRPFLVVQEEDYEEIEDATADFFNRLR